MVFYVRGRPLMIWERARENREKKFEGPFFLSFFFFFYFFQLYLKKLRWGKKSFPIFSLHPRSLMVHPLAFYRVMTTILNLSLVCRDYLQNLFLHPHPNQWLESVHPLLHLWSQCAASLIAVNNIWYSNLVFCVFRKL